MGIEGIVDKGKDLIEAGKDKIEDVLESDAVENISDKVLDGVAGVAKKVAPEEHHETIDKVRDNIDGAIGKE